MAKRWPVLVAVGAIAAVLVAVIALVPDDDNNNDNGGGGSLSAGENVEVPDGGELVIGAEQEPLCMDWINSCAGSSWGYWMANVPTMPRAFDVVEQDDGSWAYEASNLLTGEPELSGEVETVITYAINPDAVWSDGQPVTCDDWHYTWDQIVNGSDIYDPTGYTSISAVDCPDDRTVVVHLDDPDAAWQGLFGGQYGIMPAHILEGADRFDTMQNGYEFSGGPWRIDHWDRGMELVLVPNENYWGELPHLDQVTFRFMSDPITAFAAGETSMIYPQPQIEAVDAVASSPNSAVLPSAGIEALWMNNASPPFDSQVVRQAFAYALDRDAIVEEAYGALDMTEALQGFNPTILGDFGDPQAFGRYEQDVAEVDELMQSDGWTKGGGGIWEKEGKQAEVVFTTVVGNPRRELVQDLVISQAAEAGFLVTPDNHDAATLFTDHLPAGDFQLTLYAQVNVGLDPILCSFFCTAHIPTETNVGFNWTRTDIPELDEILGEVESSLDDAEQSDLQAEVDALLAESATSLPLYDLPNILMWHDEVVGPIEANPILGPWHNMHLWGVEP